MRLESCARVVAPRRPFAMADEIPRSGAGFAVSVETQTQWLLKRNHVLATARKEARMPTARLGRRWSKKWSQARAHRAWPSSIQTPWGAVEGKRMAAVAAASAPKGSKPKDFGGGVFQGQAAGAASDSSSESDVRSRADFERQTSSSEGSETEYQ